MGCWCLKVTGELQKPPCWRVVQCCCICGLMFYLFVFFVRLLVICMVWVHQTTHKWRRSVVSCWCHSGVHTRYESAFLFCCYRLDSRNSDLIQRIATWFKEQRLDSTNSDLIQRITTWFNEQPKRFRVKTIFVSLQTVHLPNMLPQHDYLKVTRQQFGESC